MEQAPERVAERQPLSCLLSGKPSWTISQRIVLFRDVLLAVRSMHERGLVHRQLDLDHVLVGPTFEPSLAVADVSCLCGLDRFNPEACPPELAGSEPLKLGGTIQEVGAALASRGIECDARRIDVYQLGVLLCWLITGEPVAAYLYDAEVKRRIPPALQTVVDRALGYEASSRLNDCHGLLELLDAASREPDALDPAAAMSDTPRDGSRIAADADTAAFPRLATPAATPSFASCGLSGTSLGHFRIVERIGRGGMGDVYKGYDESLDRFVAVKVLPPELARDEEFVRRFRAEAVAAAKIGHPNIVPVYFIGHDAGLHFFAMHYVEGESLAQRLRRTGRLSADQASRIVEQCLSALQAAHARGLVHRDVKPGNILLETETDRALVVDFGLVRGIGSSQMTVTGTVMGTVDYFAPEQARGEAVDGRADIYSLGIVFYQLLAGRLPYHAENPTAMVFQHAYVPPFPLDEASPDTPAPLRAVIARMMAKSPAERYQSCREVSDDLQAIRQGRLPAAPPNAMSSEPSRSATVLRAPGPNPELEMPDRLAELAASQGIGRLRDWAATMFRRHAPEFVKELQTTNQWVDSAVAEYERRCRRLTGLEAEARAIAAALATQILENQKAADEAAREAESSGSPDRLSAQMRREQCEKNVNSLARQQAEQQSEIDNIELQLRKAKATLARICSQRDILRARYGAAVLQCGLETGRLTSRPQRLSTVMILLAALGIAGLVVVPLALYLEPKASLQHKAPYKAPAAPRNAFEKSNQTGGFAAFRFRKATEAEINGQAIRNSIGMEFVRIPEGEFRMGTDKRDMDILRESTSGEEVLDDEHGPNEMPIHRVRISKAFYIGRFEVTQSEYLRIMGNNPSKWVPAAGQSRDAANEYQYYPVDSVMGIEADAFCEKLSATEEERTAGRTYRLPTEAEWEYACRAGTETDYYFGDQYTTNGFNHARPSGARDHNASEGSTRPAGSFSPNAFGIYDMHGNVWEWCSDSYSRDFYQTSPLIDPRSTRGEAERVMRGGSCADPAVACRSAFRGHANPRLPCRFPTGFRVVCLVAASVAPAGAR
jgi:formylglycine-generating enzyme required for sulfatase activity/serine/threonine protein kinase